jgi:hypothetical protein
MKSVKWFCLAVAVAASAALVARQSTPALDSISESTNYGLKQVLDGSMAPLSLMQKDLPADYREVLIQSADSAGTNGLAYYSMNVGGGAEGDVQRGAIRALAVFTSGQIVTVDGVRYYLTYRPLIGPDLHISLIKVETVSSITPIAAPTAREQAASERTLSISRLKQCGLATLMYCNDYDDRFPSGQSTAQVADQLYPYVKNRTVFQSPVPGGQFHFNMNLSGHLSTEVSQPATTPIWKEDLPDKSAPFGVGYADGHVKERLGDDHAEVDRAWRNWKG